MATTTVWQLTVINVIVSMVFVLGAKKRKQRSRSQRNSVFVGDEADASGGETEDEDLNESDDFENCGDDFINDDDVLSETEIERCDDGDSGDANCG